MTFSDLVESRFTFGRRFNNPAPVTAADPQAWFAGQLAAPVADDAAVLSRLAAVQLPITLTATDGTSTTENRGLNDLFLSPEALWALVATDTTANKALSRRPADEVAAARWIRGAFSPWQVREVMVDFWHNHFSIDAYQSSQISAVWPSFDSILRTNALGNFRAMLGFVAKSTAMMFYLNQNSSVASHPNENFAREVMELHTLGIGRYLGEVTLTGEAGTGYSDQDVTNAARILTGWTIADGHQKAADGSQPNTGAFLFNPHSHDFGAKTLFGRTYPAGVGQAEGEAFLDGLAGHPGTALTIATKLYVRFVQDKPPANAPIIQTMAEIFQRNVQAPNQIALVLQALVASSDFAASAGQKVKTPFEFLMSLIRATGAEVNPQASLGGLLSAMGAPLFHWPSPNGMPDVASAWTGTNDMLRRWTAAEQVTSVGANILQTGAGAIFAPASYHTPGAAALRLAREILAAQPAQATLVALVSYAVTNEVLGASNALTDPVRLGAGLRRLTGAIAASPEFQLR